MRTRLPVALAAASALALAATAVTANAAPSTSGADRTGYIVVLEDFTAPGKVAREHAERHGATVSFVYRHALKGYAARMSPVAAARIADDRRVAFVQEDGVVSIAGRPEGAGKPDGTGKPDKPGGGGGAKGQTLPTGVDRVDAEGKSFAGAIDVAVIDTGVDLDHLDLNVYTAGAKNCSTGKSADDGNGHGTHVAGTIGAKDNTIGVVGVAPGAKIWPVRVLNNAGSGTFSSIICGIDFVTDNAQDIEVANMSLGGPGSDNGTCGAPDANGNGGDAMHAAICEMVSAGVAVVVAAGNESDDAANYVPAAYDEVITVSALADFDGKAGGLNQTTETPCRTDVDDTFADFSNWGADVDLIAPGVCILSTWKGGGYNTISGTSMAAPHVAGGAALYLAKNPSAKPADVQAALQDTKNFEWNNGDDKDEIKEPLLNVKDY